MSRITASLSDGVLVIQPLIDPVASESNALREEILEQLEATSDYQSVQFNLESVKILDSSGIGVLIATYNTLKAKSIGLRIARASEDIAGLLKSMGLNNHFPIETD